MGKEKKNNVLTHFFISYKSDVETFLKWIVNKCPEGTCLHDPQKQENANEYSKGIC